MKIDPEQYARTVEELPAERLSRISELAQRMAVLEQQLIDLANATKTATEELTQIAEQRLPDAMTELGVLELKLADGSKVTLATSYYAQIPKRSEDEAFSWLRAHGFDSLIKHEFKASFGKGEDKEAQLFEALAMEHDVAINAKTGVHPQTLRAFVKEQAEAGHPVPDDLFGVYIKTQAQIRR